MSGLSRLEQTGGLEDDNPDFGPDPEPEPVCRARSGECDLNGRCYRCDAIEGEHCREAGRVSNHAYDELRAMLTERSK